LSAGTTVLEAKWTAKGLGRGVTADPWMAYNKKSIRGSRGGQDCILSLKGYMQTKNECRVGRKHKYRSLRILEKCGR